MTLHFITGATGCVGGALTLELLARSDAQVACLVRAPRGDHQGAQQRLAGQLTAAARAYDLSHLVPEIGRRVRAVPGDILERSCGDAARALANVSDIWHCAASLKYKADHETEIFQHNVDGTRNVLDLARELRCPVLNYVSTAYVCGRRSAQLTEALPVPGTPTHNCYEESKIRAELMVSKASPVPARILRPSIVIGHSRTCASVSTSGLYGSIQALIKLRRRAAARGEAAVVNSYRFKLIADPHATVDLIPIDVIAANAVRISLANAQPGVFHLTNACPPLVGDVTRLIFKTLGLAEPIMVGSADAFSPLDAALGRSLQFYGAYLTQQRNFDRANTDAVLGPEASYVPLDDKRLKPFIDWYVQAAGDAGLLETDGVLTRSTRSIEAA